MCLVSISLIISLSFYYPSTTKAVTIRTPVYTSIESDYIVTRNEIIQKKITILSLIHTKDLVKDAFTSDLYVLTGRYELNLT